ncbi:MAG: DNA primase [Candidatus Paceibacterota bacterium]
MSSPVQQVKDRLNIVDVISHYVKLEKAGANFKGKCPFHNEKTGSFFVSPSRQTYHCFGCNEGGDIFSFIEAMDGVSFKEALSILANRAGVKLENQSFSKTDKGNESSVLDAIEEAVKFYQKNLQHDNQAQVYLQERGVNQGSFDTFRLGLAPSEWRSLYDHLSVLGFSKKNQLEAGLIIEATTKDGRPVIYDRFRSRIMFPIFDLHGRPIAFSGRIFGPEAVEKTSAKYINSPQTSLFDKSRVLYAYNLAKDTIRQTGQAVLVEGQMDVVLSHQIGISNAIAVSGTALTYDHVVILKRLAKCLIMAFDADEAGIKAMKRALEIIFEAGLEVKVASMPEGLDPADMAKDTPEGLKKIIKEPVDVVEYYLDLLVKKYKDKRSLSKAISEEIYPIVAKINRLTDKAHYVKNISDVTTLAEEIIWQDLYDSTTREVISNRGQTSQKLNKTVLESKVTTNKTLAHLLGLWWQSNGEQNLTENEVFKKIAQIIGSDNLTREIEKLQADKNKILLEVDLMYTDSGRLDEYIKELAEGFVNEYLKNELAVQVKNLKTAEKLQDHKEMDKSLKKCQDISGLLNNLHF